KIISGLTFGQIYHLPQNSLGKVDRDFLGDSANACTSTARVRDSRTPQARRNPSRPARSLALLLLDQAQSADEKQCGNVRVVMVRNAPERVRLRSVAGATHERK